MRAVVADTGPLNYLVLIDLIHLLPMLFETVFVPEAVKVELSHAEAPVLIREWIASPPPWLAVRRSPIGQNAVLQSLHEGERAAILLALSLNAALILMDDRKGAAAARDKGFAVAGTLGLLDLAAKRGLVNLAEAFGRLRQTSFRCRADLLDAILANHLAK